MDIDPEVPNLVTREDRFTYWEQRLENAYKQRDNSDIRRCLAELDAIHSEPQP